MLFVGAGIVLMLLKYLEIGSVAKWEWWWVLSPFGLAVIWWWIADSSGYTARTEMKREEARVKERIRRNREAMGMDTKKRR